MGKSDPIVFNFYTQILSSLRDLSIDIAFLGFSGKNDFVNFFRNANIDLYDIQSGEGVKFLDINSPQWETDKAYDLVICTRCPYFAQDPTQFITNCQRLCKDHGVVFIDWGLGDHWRFENFKVGWKKDGEQEFSEYNDQKHFLHSCYYHPDLELDPHVLKFRKNIVKFGYDLNTSLRSIIEEEVPQILEAEDMPNHITYTLSLWEDAPQLYIVNLIKN